ncbi:MAG: LD-carboxypeptidase [Desulfobulbus sp.]|nr:MAG: LD-carboxypeptidase [Desulfobulbus sp.]
MSCTLLPAPLKAGDTLGIFYPAGPVKDLAAFEDGLTILRNLGFSLQQRLPDNSGPDYLAASDESRIGELHRLWADDNIKALIAARGGYGCLRIIEHLDFTFLRSRPKWLIGFSDLTVLLNGIYKQTGMITLHGPVVTSLPRLDRASLDSFKNLISGVFADDQQFPGLEILRGGQGTGHLAGGNLTTLTHLIGTPWQPDFSGSILFLEDTAEPEYKLDRMLTHLSSCGALDNLAGLLLGFFDPGHDDTLETLRLNEHIWARTLELTKSANYPVWGAFPVGHQTKNHALPLGMQATIDSSRARLSFLHQACPPWE